MGVFLASLVAVDVFLALLVAVDVFLALLGLFSFDSICYPERSEGSRLHLRECMSLFEIFRNAQQHIFPPLAPFRITIRKQQKTSTSNSEAHLSSPLENRPLVEEREEKFCISRKERKAV